MIHIRALMGATLLALGACHAPSYEEQAVLIDDLLFGPEPSNTTLERLRDEGYRTVISVQPTSEQDWNEKQEVDRLGMRLITIPMPKPVLSISEEQIDRFDEAMESAPRPMLLHCSSGNRVAGLYAVWLATRKGVPAEEAVRSGKAAGMTRLRPLVRKTLGLPTGS